LGEKLTWRKFKLWEESNRTPLIVVAPGITGVGGRCPSPVSLLDIYPTLVDLCRLPPVTELEGESLTPLLENPHQLRESPAVMTYGLNNHAVRTDRWRYIVYRDGTEELYDHRFDPMEWVNLADKRQFAPIKADLARWLPSVNAPPARTAVRVD
jgi:arylsulfatase A-like enzyme